MLTLISMTASAQGKHPIKGMVLDEKAEPLPFATVLLGNGIGTVTDLEGRFSVDLPEEELATELTASFVGYQATSLLWQQATASQPVIFRLTPGIDLPVVEVTFISVSRCILTRCVSYVAKEEFLPKTAKSPPVLSEASIIVINTYPNPFVSTINVEMEVLTPEPFQFQLHNGSGQLVFAETMELPTGLQTLQLDLVQRHLPEGAYFLRISNGKGEVRTNQLVKVSP